MSDLITSPQLSDSKDCADPSFKPIHQKLNTRTAQVGDNITIRRALPHRDRKMIGAWCFMDHFGPLDLKNTKGLSIGPHPHIGLQTFTWTLAGEILHRDSLGSKQLIQPGQVNLMTAGKGISHSEESVPDTLLHGVQLWIALPDSARKMEPNFIHYPEIPSLKVDGLQIHLLAGELLNSRSPIKAYSPLVGFEIHALENSSSTLPLNPKFEYGILPLIGNVKVEDETIGIDTLLYLGCGRSKLAIQAKKDAQILVIGGQPFEEEVLIWWNFVARTREEMLQAKQAWNEHRDFGEVKGFPGDRLTAPELP